MGAPVTRPRGDPSVRAYSLRHLADSTLRHDLKQLVITDRGTNALIVAHIAEFIARKLYLEDGYGSMYHYCVGALGMSEDIACRRIRAARAARRFPLIFPALADGRIHLTADSLLAPHLTEENAEALLASAFYKTKREIQLLIATRFPRPDLPTFMERLGVAPAAPGTAPSPPGAQGPPPVPSSAPARIEVPPPCVTPLARGGSNRRIGRRRAKAERGRIRRLADRRPRVNHLFGLRT